MEIQNALKKNLKGEALINALGFVEYLTQKGLTPDKVHDKSYDFVTDGKTVCNVVFNVHNQGEWFVASEIMFLNPDTETLDKFKENVNWCTNNLKPDETNEIRAANI